MHASRETTPKSDRTNSKRPVIIFFYFVEKGIVTNGLGESESLEGRKTSLAADIKLGRIESRKCDAWGQGQNFSEYKMRYH